MYFFVIYLYFLYFCVAGGSGRFGAVRGYGSGRFGAVRGDGSGGGSGGGSGRFGARFCSCLDF